MDVLQAVENIGRHLRDFAEQAAQKVEQELPVVQQLAQQAATNPAAVALLGSVHLSAAPELLQALADTIGKIEAGLAAAHEAGVQEAHGPAPEAPAEPAT